jgi:dienelactone hydrolase
MKKFLLVCSLLLVSATAIADAEVRLDTRHGEQIVQVPKKSGLFSFNLEATLFKPPGNGPFPLIVINHGKAPGNPKFQARARYPRVAAALVERGFVVLMPMRQGFSKSEGSYISGGCNVASNGLLQTDDVVAAIDYAKTLPYVNAEKIVIFGQSHGGLTTMALGTREIPGVLGLVNFAGGLRMDNCAGWEANLVAAFAEYGKSAHYPSLWFYGDNDGYWPTDLWHKMFEAYNQASGGKARMVAYGTYGSNSHMMFGASDSLDIWLPETGKFMHSLGIDFSVNTSATSPRSDD